VVGARGAVLAADAVERGRPSTREVIGEFEQRAQAVIVASGGIGANHELVRRHWPSRLGPAPAHMLCGVPAHVDGRMLAISEAAGAQLINRDRMWHYVEGIENWNPIWPGHAIRILPGPSSLWFDATGRRLPGPLWPGYDTMGTLAWLRQTGYDYSWFVLDQQIIVEAPGIPAELSIWNGLFAGAIRNTVSVSRSLQLLEKVRAAGAAGSVAAGATPGAAGAVPSAVLR